MKRFLLLCLFCSTLCSDAQIDTLPLPSPNGTFRALLIDNTNATWIASGTGVKRHTASGWTFFQSSSSGLPNNIVKAMVQDQAGKIWFGTGNGLASYDGTTWSVLDTSNSPLPSNNINCMLMAPGNTMWIGTPNGLCSFDGTNWMQYNTSNSALNSNSISCLQLVNSSLYIGTAIGVSILNAGTVQNLPLISNVSEVAIDGSNVWVRNNFGLFKLVNGEYQNIDDVYDLCGLSGGLAASPYSIAAGINGGITLVLSDNLINFGTGTYSYIRTPSAAHAVMKVIPSGNYYYTLEQGSGGSPNLMRVDMTQLHPTVNPLDHYNVTCYTNKLSINQVNATILDRGDMFWDLNSHARYEVPKGSGSMATFAGCLWLGGKVNGQLRTACQTYRQGGTDFWPGPLDTTDANNAPSTALIPIARVNQLDIDGFIYNFQHGNVQSGAYTPSRGILNWPTHGTGNFSRVQAPYVDLNHNGVYDPMVGGDYPIIKGDQELFHIYNDASGTHMSTRGTGKPMGLEIRQKSYAYYCPGIADSLKAINYTTFYEFEIINRGDTLIDSMYVGYWNDTDLGYYSDDYVGCNVTGNYGYVYNGDTFDEDANGIVGYHSDLPCFSTAILRSPPALLNDGKDNDHDGVIDEPNEEAGMSSFIYYSNTSNGVTGNPVQQTDYYNFLRARWKNGNTMMYGGDGVSGTIATTYQFPGNSDPVGYGTGGQPGSPSVQPAWTETTAGMPAGDRRFLINSGPFQLAAKDTTTVVYALVFTQVGSSNNFAAIPQNELDVKRIRNWYLNDNFPGCLTYSPVGIKEQRNHDLVARMYPNPAASLVTIETEDYRNASVSVCDVLGQVLLNKQLNAKTETLNIEQLPTGIYLMCIKNAAARKTFKLVVSR